MASNKTSENIRSFSLLSCICIAKDKGAKHIRPEFFIEIVERKMIENMILQQIVGFLWLFSVYPSHP